MKNLKTIIQDILNTVLLFSLVGVGIEAKLQPLVSARTIAEVDLILGALGLLVYYADVIFGFTNTTPPPPTPTPSV